MRTLQSSSSKEVEGVQKGTSYEFPQILKHFFSPLSADKKQFFGFIETHVLKLKVGND
jgi:hypothetical protein